MLASRTVPDQFEKEDFARDLASEVSGLVLYPLSLVRLPGAVLLAAQEGLRRRILLLTDRSDETGFQRPPVSEFRRNRLNLLVYDADWQLVHSLMEKVSWLRPRPNPGRPSLGLGDRLGLATPAHVRAVESGNLFPYFAQQSPAENAVAGRSWGEVLADAVFGVWREGWDRGYGADADHLTTAEDVLAAADAGFVRFTLDVSGEIEPVFGLDRQALSRRFVAIEREVPGANLWRRNYLGKELVLSTGSRRINLVFDERAFLTTAVRLGRAVDKAAGFAAQAGAACRGRPYEIELALDGARETTTLHEHFFAAREMADRGFPLALFAPRFVGEFKRGAEFKGRPGKFARNLTGHAAVAASVAGHAVSLHDGSDKFSLYPYVGDACDGRFSVKTSGTSFIEALRLAARKNRGLFEEIISGALDALERGELDLQVELDRAAMPSPGTLDDEELERFYFNSLEGRQLLFEAYRVALDNSRELKTRFKDLLTDHEESHFDLVAGHLGKHANLLEKGVS